MVPWELKDGQCRNATESSGIHGARIPTSSLATKIQGINSNTAQKISPKTDLDTVGSSKGTPSYRNFS